MDKGFQEIRVTTSMLHWHWFWMSPKISIIIFFFFGKQNINNYHLLSVMISNWMSPIVSINSLIAHKRNTKFDMHIPFIFFSPVVDIGLLRRKKKKHIVLCKDVLTTSINNITPSIKKCFNSNDLIRDIYIYI